MGLINWVELLCLLNKLFCPRHQPTAPARVSTGQESCGYEDKSKVAKVNKRDEEKIPFFVIPICHFRLQHGIRHLSQTPQAGFAYDKVPSLSSRPECWTRRQGLCYLPNLASSVSYHRMPIRIHQSALCLLQLVLSYVILIHEQVNQDHHRSSMSPSLYGNPPIFRFREPHAVPRYYRRYSTTPCLDLPS